MSTTDYAAVLTAIRPGASWTLEGDVYAGLTWLDDTPKPTQKTLDDAWPQVQHDRDVAAAEDDRRARYQADTDGLYFHAVANAEPLDAWKAARAKVKLEVPDPKPVKR